MFVFLMVEGARSHCRLYKGLGFEDVFVPAWAAGFSAFGCGAADFEYRYDKTLDINVADTGDSESF